MSLMTSISYDINIFLGMHHNCLSACTCADSSLASTIWPDLLSAESGDGRSVCDSGDFCFASAGTQASRGGPINRLGISNHHAAQLFLQFTYGDFAVAVAV